VALLAAQLGTVCRLGDPLDANSRRRGRSGSLGQVSGRWKSLGAARGRWRCCTCCCMGSDRPVTPYGGYAIRRFRSLVVHLGMLELVRIWSVARW
jgi:hypothetical protein